MEHQNKESQEIEQKSSTENKDESIEETILRAEALLDNKEVELDSSEPELTQAEPEQGPEAGSADKPATEEPSEEEDEDDYADLPSSYKKETRELFKKLPKGFESLGKAFAKRAHEVEKQRAKMDSEYQSKTAFARKIAESVNPYLDSWVARGITPEVGVARAAKLDNLIQQDPEAAVKFIMQMTGIRAASLDSEEIEKIEQARSQKPLTSQPTITQDDIRRITQQEVARATHHSAAAQTNMQVLDGMISKKTSSGKDLYPQLKDEGFVREMTPLVETLIQTRGLSFDKAVIAAYHANGGRVEPDFSRPGISQSQQRDSQKIERLKVASNIRPANSSSNSMNMDDIKIPDSIEDTILLAERLASSRS